MDNDIDEAFEPRELGILGYNLKSPTVPRAHLYLSGTSWSIKEFCRTTNARQEDTGDPFVYSTIQARAREVSEKYGLRGRRIARTVRGR